MATSTRIPHLIEAYLQLPPEASLILLSSVLNATNNWIVLRYLLTASKNSISDAQDSIASASIVFVSFLRHWDFWRDGARRLGLDLNQARTAGRITFVDGLSQLFSGKPQREASTTVDGANILITADRISSIEALVFRVLNAAATGSTSKPLLILDGLDFLLAGTQITSSELLSSMMTWRGVAHATILSVSGDGPLLHSQQTPLETEHAAFVTSLIHQAYFVMSTRLLSTGAASDVSGVLRVSRGGAVDDLEQASEVEEKEVLYLVGGDGNVKVFGRGAG